MTIAPNGLTVSWVMKAPERFDTVAKAQKRHGTIRGKHTSKYSR
jgi:hypothetical protein